MDFAFNTLVPPPRKKKIFILSFSSIFSYERQCETALATRDKSQGRGMEDPLQRVWASF